MQKKVLALHDLSGFGRSSLVPIIALLSAMGHQCVPVPTAVFSTHTAIEGYIVHDLTGDLLSTVDQYENLGLQFEAVYSGFLSSEKQINSISQAILRLRSVDSVVLVDPVMGDNGEIYQTYTTELCRRMGDLCRLADVITPNITEAAILLGQNEQYRPKDALEAAQWAKKLEEIYGAHVVLTGICNSKAVGVMCCEHGRTAFFEHARIGAYYPGTGDIFASVLLGRLLHGDALSEAAICAASFVRDCIARTEELGANYLHGVQFEPLLGELFAQ